MFNFKEMGVPQLKELLTEEPPRLRLIDVRTPAEVERGAISGAEHLPLHVLPLKAAEIQGDDLVVFYCQSGARSAQACAFLASQGHDQVFNLRGGIMAWMQYGHAVA